MAAHRRNVAQAASERFMADGARRVGCARKVDVLDEEVRGEYEVFAGLGLVDRAVVADASLSPGVLPRLSLARISASDRGIGNTYDARQSGDMRRSTTTMTSADRSPTALAVKPMTGGPLRNPR